MARILLVEDDIDVRPLLEHLLDVAGYAVTAVETATNALRLLEGSPFDLVLTDGMLADGTGLDVAEKAAALGVPALILTGYALKLPPERLSRFECLFKPIRAPALLATLQRLLRPRDEDGSAIVRFPKSG